MSIPRPVIIEGVAILELLEKLKKSKNYLIYVENEEFEGSFGLSEIIKEYEEKYNPKGKADFVLQLKH